MKPANVKVTPSGQVKVLDFGLAKAFGSETDEAGSVNLSHNPTLTRATATGIILGTAAYMSPEQARGEPVDKRTDIWAFGVVLFEMLSGRNHFWRNTMADTLSSVLSESPDWESLPAEVPVNLRRMLARCLSKSADRRLRDIGDARIELDDALLALRSASSGVASLDGTMAFPEEVARPRRRQRLWLWAVTGLMLGAGLTSLIGWFGLREHIMNAERTVPVRFSIPPTRDAVFGEFLADPYPAVSPDGSMLAYVASDSNAKNRLPSLNRWTHSPPHRYPGRSTCSGRFGRPTAATSRTFRVDS